MWDAHILRRGTRAQPQATLAPHRAEGHKAPTHPCTHAHTRHSATCAISSVRPRRLPAAPAPEGTAQFLGSSQGAWRAGARTASWTPVLPWSRAARRPCPAARQWWSRHAARSGTCERQDVGPGGVGAYFGGVLFLGGCACECVAMPSGMLAVVVTPLCASACMRRTWVRNVGVSVSFKGQP